MTAIIFLKKVHLISQGTPNFDYIPAEDEQAEETEPTNPTSPTSSHVPNLANGNGPAKLPDWSDEQQEGIWKKYGNKVRCGDSGVLFYTGKRNS